MGEWADSPLLRSTARRDLQRAAVGRFGKIVADATFAGEFQQALHCNLVGRQRRWVATQPALMSSHVAPLTFFVDRAYRTFWMSVGLEDLTGQDLYLRYGESRFPLYFPRRPTAITRLIRRVDGRVRRDLNTLVNRAPPAKRPPPIIRAKLLAPHFDQIRAALTRASPLLNDVVDVAGLHRSIDAFARGEPCRDLSSGMLFRAINVMHLLDLREERREPAI
jgi:hypothetical protein